MLDQFRKHYSDEDLLAHLDGELPILRDALVKKHLNLCWECRHRSHELEAQTRAIAQMLRNDRLLSHDHAAQARLKFLARRQRFEESLSRVPEFHLFSAPSFRLAGLAFISALILLGFLGSSFKAGRSRASEILARTQAVDGAFVQTALLVHQTFQIRFREIEPETHESLGRLEIWSDPHGRRFASRWQDSGGLLRHAVWRSGADKQYVYNRDAGTAVAAKIQSVESARSLVDYLPATADVSQLEYGLMEWLETRDWRPITLSSDLQMFASQDGAILRSEREASGLCLQVERTVGGVRIEYSLQLAINSYQPHLQRIRFAAPGHVTEVELSNEQCSLISPNRIDNTVFEPESRLLSARAPDLPLVSPQRSPTQSKSNFIESQPKAAAGVDKVALAALEMEARYALHRVSADLGEPIEVVQVTDGAGSYVEVRGLADTRQRAQELRAALTELGNVRINIRTSEEVLQEKTRDFPTSGIATTSGDTRILLANRHPLIQDRLERFFSADRPSGIPTAQRIAEFSTQVISSSQRALSVAWALRHLAERYGKVTRGDLLPRSRWLLEAMVRDNVNSLQTETRSIQALLKPFIWPPQEQSDAEPNSSAALNAVGADWMSVGLSLFSATSAIDESVRLLFADGGSPQGAGPSDSGGIAPSVEQVIKELINGFGHLNSGFEWFGSSSSREAFQTFRPDPKAM
jgi:hypothetical protein